jgi:hypothetical protein
VQGTFGARSGIDEYYMQFLVKRVAAAATQAAGNLQPATLWATQVPIPPALDVNLSTNFPTTADATDATFPKAPGHDYRPAAIDPKIGVLQARSGTGNPIFTVMSLAAHNQEIGHSGLKDTDGTPLNQELSSDWPGYFHRALEARIGGMAMYLVGDNGSEEDPKTVPPVDATRAECSNGRGGTDGCYPQAEATGNAFADAVEAAAGKADPLGYGRVTLTRQAFYPPIENNLFVAAAKGGLFGTRQTYVGTEDSASPAGQDGNRLQSYVSFMNIGPDLQLLENPGESFPALIVGSPFGIEDAECPGRLNPAVPAWHARAPYRFSVGLADDMIGYLIPAWAYRESQQGVFAVDQCDLQGTKHKHKLESEGVGPTASNAVGDRLAALLDTRPDRVAQVRLGRYVHADGSLSRNPLGAIAVWLADRGSTSLKAGTGTIVGTLGYAAFGSRKLDAVGFLMDYDGSGEPDADIKSRGMLYLADNGALARRYYVDVYPHLDVTKLPAAVRGEPPANTPGLAGAQDYGLGTSPLGLSSAGDGPAPGAAGRCAKARKLAKARRRHRTTSRRRAHRSATRAKSCRKAAKRRRHHRHPRSAARRR